MKANTYLYETHLHTSPVSKCALAGVRETVEFYKSLSYAGIFVTNHFIDGNINIDKSLPFEERIRFYFSDYEEALRIGKEVGIDVFCGVEMSYHGTDFLVYGPNKDWYLAHPEIEELPRRDLLTLLASEGALIIHAHPYREASYIECIRLFPRHVHGVEIYNSSRKEAENRMAEIYAEGYGLLPFAGSDNHVAAGKKVLGGMQSAVPVKDAWDFVRLVKEGAMTPFCKSIE